VLGFNYPGDIWYRDAYRLLTDRGLRPATEPKGGGVSRLFRIPFLKSKGGTLKPPAPAPAAPVAAGAPKTY